MTSCDSCVNYVYDDEEEMYYCDCDLDEDDMYRFMTSQTFDCRFYRYDDEYGVVRHQM